jgi:hypothetical protein
MEKTLRKFAGPDVFQQMKDEAYRYWHTRPDQEVFNTIAEMSESAWNGWYKMKGIVPNAGPARSLTRVQRVPR